MKMIAPERNEIDEPHASRFECKECGYQTSRPSWSDTSMPVGSTTVDMIGRGQVLEYAAPRQTLHVPVCPRCIGDMRLMCVAAL
jgi:hypothetical protein